MRIHKDYLAHRMRSDEGIVERFILAVLVLPFCFTCLLIQFYFRILRTRFQAAAATHAFAEWIRLLLLLLRLTGSGACVVIAIHRYSALQLL